MADIPIRNPVESKFGDEFETFQFLTYPDSGASLFHQLFSIDLRSLAALRIVIGLILIGYVLGESNNLKLLYSDDGVLSLAVNRQLIGEDYWSLYWINGTDEFARVLLITTVLAAGAFVLGFKTWLMNLVCLILLWSLQVRNPLVLSGGDVLLRMLFFWSLFLPTSAIWSIDAIRAEERPARWVVSSVATLAIMLQVVYMYFFSGLAKLNPFWLSGDAIEYAMNLEMSVKPLGTWLLSYPDVLRVLTIAILVAEILTLLVMFIPRVYQFNRGWLMGFFWMMHIAIWLTMSIGLFSMTAIAAWVIFVPSDIWNSLVGEPVGFSEKKNYESVSESEFEWWYRIQQLVCGLFLAYITFQNLAFALGPSTANRFSTLQRFGRATMTIQKFHMFAEPPLFSPWFEYTALLDSGERSDLFSSRNRNPGEKPDSVFNYLGSQTWRRLHWNLITHPLFPPEEELVYRDVRRRLLDLMVRNWDANHRDDPVVEAVLKCHLEPIVLSGRRNSDRIEFVNHEPHDIVWATYENEAGIED